jgi:glycosyltransferase involved in cell wall biosynthesis
LDWRVAALFLTLAEGEVSKMPRGTQFLGTLAHDEMLNIYQKVDALVFPSKQETVGFPLLEAMHIGLPIVVSDRPFARDLCGNVAIYFDPDSTPSLISAVHEMWARLRAGWWPDWTDQLRGRPANWRDVAKTMVEAMQASGHSASMHPAKARGEACD